NWNGKVITYDANGCMTQKGTGTTYSWGANRRLASVSNGSTVSYAYDLSGARIRKTVNGTLTEYRWGGSLLLSEKTGSDTICYFYDSTGMQVGMTLNNILYLYIRNLQGDVIGITDRNGNVVVQYSYDSWGNIISTTGSMATTVGAKNPFRYRGYYYDVETGMYYLKTRYYDPEIRRFISPDLFIQTGIFNLCKNMFLYCLNNPISRIDIDGKVGVQVLIVAVVSLTKAVMSFPYDNPRRIDWTEKLDTEIEKNYAELVKYRKQHNLWSTLMFFVNKVKTGGDWDFKNKSEWDMISGYDYYYRNKLLRHDDPGNIHYGYVGAALFHGNALASFAGKYQAIQDFCHGKSPQFNHWYSYLDDPRDTEMIVYGYLLWQQAHNPYDYLNSPWSIPW
ncbi:MAG: hypothetical protein IJX90_01425, partial [Blautia sp.]|nr:hypothetical protein [Blautia sp.]